jgi:hypothetical protein
MNRVRLRASEKWAITLVCLLGVGFCIYRWAATNATPLLAPLYSNICPDQARQTLNLPAERWIVTTNSDYRGAQRTSMDVSNFVDCGVTGTLSVSFFNQRLTQTIFYPSDFDLYLKSLKRERKISFGPARRNLSLFWSIWLYPHTSVWIGKDYRGKDYVCWEDRKIADEDTRRD